MDRWDEKDNRNHLDRVGEIDKEKMRDSIIDNELID
jgi:hypothetical protein